MTKQRTIAALGMALAATAMLTPDADAQRGGRGRGAQLPQVSCPGAVATPQASSAQDELNRTFITQGGRRLGHLMSALGQTTAGIAADANNPYHHFQRGQALVGLVEFHGQAAVPAYSAVFPQSSTISADEAAREGTESLQRAADLCPDFAAEADTLRARTSQSVFALGLERFQAGDTATTLTLWEAVTRMDSTNVDAVFNTAVVAYLSGQRERAMPLYRRTLVLTTPGDTATDDAREGAFSALASYGAVLFSEEKFRETAELYTYLNTVDPNHRDSWYNHALALYKLENWQALIPVATRVTQTDPLNYNAQIILFNAYKGISDAAKARNDAATETANRNQALAALERADGLPILVDNITVETNEEETSTTLRGVATGGTAAQGTPIQLEFTLTNMNGVVGTGSVTIPAPAKDANANFEVVIPVTGLVTSYRYRKTN